MYFTGDTLDDLLFDVYEELLRRPFENTSTRGGSGAGNTSEIIGASLRLSNSRARLSRTETKGKLFSAVGELLWYLSKDNKLDFIKYYIPKYVKESEDNVTVYGGYGPRLFNSGDKINQIGNVIKLLTEKPSSRRAAIQIFEAKDIENVNYKEIPCTCTLQFILRQGKLNLIVFMRSNDAFFGLPHDVFVFTMIQELVARSVNVELGEYIHSVGSLHLYEKDKPAVEIFLSEGRQSTQKNMDAMPEGDQWNIVDKLLVIEANIREGNVIDHSKLEIDEYWRRVVFLLETHRCIKTVNLDGIKEQRENLKNTVFKTYIDMKILEIEAKIKANNAK